MWGVGAFPSPYLVPVMEASSVRRNPKRTILIREVTAILICEARGL